METFQEHYDSLMEAIAKYTPNVDMERISRAIEYADKKHCNQKRKDGSPYIIHPLAVAQIVVESGLDTDSILGALLHDCIEDTDTNHDDIARLFGPTVADLVEGVTKLTRVEYSSLEEQQMENLRKMFMAMSKDIRVILIKIADRLHNTRTMQYQTPAKQISKSMETMDIYAPLAHRLGMQRIKWELEDTSLMYLDPNGYKELMGYLDAHHSESEEFVQAIQDNISERLTEAGIHGSISGRVKHVYSIYRKMKNQNKSIDELYDLYAFRIIVDTIPDCYNVLGHIHDLYNIVPGRFKDYISTPKPNMYQSLHTTVIGRQGIPFEVQIRTWEMHETAEYGIAAHWKYKEGIAGKGDEKEFEWVRRLLENQQEVDAEDYIHSLKVDMFDDEVFVFTPKGKVISLPSGSTPIDFAYAIHSAIGNTMVGAKINNRIAPYDQRLKNGDICEVITSKSARGPSRDWLKVCKSNQARIKIKQWFKKERRDENIMHGKSSFEGELRHMSIQPSVLWQDEELIDLLLKRNSFECLDDLFAAIGYGGLSSIKAVNRIRDDLVHANRTAKETAAREAAREAARDSSGAPKDRHKDSGIIVDGVDSCMIKFSRCCTPVPGDDIVGFITKGNGVSIHRRDCVNVRSMADPQNAGRWVNVEWNSDSAKMFSTSLEVRTLDRTNMLLDLATVLSTSKVHVSEIAGKNLPDGKVLFTVTFEVNNVKGLEAVLYRVRCISGVLDVRRGQQ